jgi:MYXO-CTERM domain-containing protein
MMKTVSLSFQRFLAAALSFSLLLVAGSAAADGRVEWKAKTLKESDSHAWTIEVSIFLNKPPDISTLPVRFSFQPVVYYERSLLDGKDGPQFRRVPLQNKPPNVESVDVGFLDPGNGTLQKRTKFSFKVTRAHGYEAGEYDVTIKDGRTDASMGALTHVTFEGENEVIDRRAVVFTGEKKKEKKDDDAEKKEEPMKKKLTADDPGFWQGGPKNDPDANKEEVEPKRGCGCRVGATDGHTDALGLLLVSVAIAGQRLRRRRALPVAGRQR